MDSWTYWGPSSPPAPSLHFSFPSFSLLLHCRHSGEINAEETHCFHPPAATSAIPRKKRNQNPPSAWIGLFSSLPNKEICSCAAKNSKIPEFPSVVSKADVAFLSVRFVFFLTARAVIWCFFVAPTRGQHVINKHRLIYYVNRRSWWGSDSVDVWTVWQVLTGRLEKKLRETVDQSEDSRCFHY